jgi:putative chitinase
MTPEEAKQVQIRLGVVADGDFGRQSWKSLFVHFGCGTERAAELALGAVVHVPAAEITTPLRLAHFIAQLAHESDRFKAMEEYASGVAYEGRADLGNTMPGDGRRYKGRGPIQLTGRANYREYGRKLGIDLEAHPEIAALPSIGMMTACRYWTVKGLNALADADNVEAITRKINGGTNGLADRKALLKVAKGLFL